MSIIPAQPRCGILGLARSYHRQRACLSLIYSIRLRYVVSSSILAHFCAASVDSPPLIPFSPSPHSSRKNVIPGFGYVTPELDTKFNASRSFAVVAAFFGMLAFLTMAVSSCCPLDHGRIKCLSIYFFFAFFFQALVFIIMRSNACSLGFLDPYFKGDSDTTLPFIESVSCGLSTGSNLAIAAAVLYFVCMLLVPAATPPGPIVPLTEGSN